MEAVLISQSLENTYVRNNLLNLVSALKSAENDMLRDHYLNPPPLPTQTHTHTKKKQD